MASIRISGLLVLVALGIAISPSVAVQPNTVDDALLGRWVVASITTAIDESRVDGIRASKPTTFHSVKVPSAFLVECTDGRTLTFEIQLAPSAKPKGIDLILDLQGKAQICRGIYEIAGDTLKLCVSLPEENRPTEFSANAGTKRVLLSLRRPPASDKSTRAGPAGARWEEVIRFDGHKKPVRWMSFSPDATRLAAGMTDGHVDIWDVAKAKKIGSLGNEPILFLAFMPDGKQLVTVGPGRGHALQVRLWDSATGNMQAQLGAGGGFVASVALSPDGKLMVTSSSDGNVQALAFDGNSLKRIWSASLGFRVTAIAVSPDARRIAVVGGGDSRLDRFRLVDPPIPDRLQRLDTLGELRLLDAATGKALFSIRNPAGLRALRNEAVGAIATVAFSPDGKLLASSNGADETLWLQNAKTGTDLRQLTGHADSVISLAFSPDGKLLASCGADYKVRIWDLATGKERAALPLAAAAIVLFSPDNQFLAASGGGVVRLWRERQAKDVPPMPEQKEPKKDAARPPEKLQRVRDPSWELRQELHRLETEYHHASEMKFVELEKRAEELAKRYPDKDDQARIWGGVAHVAGQSDINKHAERVKKYAARCLAISRDPVQRSRMWSLLASAVDLRGPEFPKRRQERAEILLTGYVEILAQDLPEKAPELPRVNRFRLSGDPFEDAQARAEHTAQLAARQEAEFILAQFTRRDILIMQLRDLFKPVPNYHGRNPEGPAELRALARRKLTEQQVNKLLVEVAR